MLSFLAARYRGTRRELTLSLHGALPILGSGSRKRRVQRVGQDAPFRAWGRAEPGRWAGDTRAPARLSSSPRPERSILARSEEHTSELQSHSELVCRLRLGKKKDIGVTRG